MTQPFVRTRIATAVAGLALALGAGQTFGGVEIDGVDLKFVNITPPSQIFLRMLHDEEFDASEMSLSNFMIAIF